MEAYTATHPASSRLLTHSLTHWQIRPLNALVSHLKLVPGFRACYNKKKCEMFLDVTICIIILSKSTILNLLICAMRIAKYNKKIHIFSYPLLDFD